MSLKIYFKEAIILYLIIIYFLAVTGPVFSPKYIHPILPAFIFFEALALKSIHHFFKNFSKKHKQINNSMNGTIVTVYLVSNIPLKLKKKSSCYKIG